MLKKAVFVFFFSGFLNAKALKVHNYYATQNTSYILNESAFLSDTPVGPWALTNTVGRFYFYGDLTSLNDPWIDLDERGEVFQGVLVKNAKMMDLAFGYLINEKLQLGINLPIEQLTTQINPVNVRLDGTSTTGLGDARLMAKWNFFNWRSLIGFSLMPIAYLPTGFQATNEYYATSVSTEKTGIGASWGTFGAGFKILSEFKKEKFRIGLNLGYDHHPMSTITGKSSVFGGGLEYVKVSHIDLFSIGVSTLFLLSEKWGLNLEATTFSSERQNEYTKPNEGYAGVRYKWSDVTSVHAGYGGGLGKFTVRDRFTVGIKTPLFGMNSVVHPTNVEIASTPPEIEKPRAEVKNNKIEINKVIEFESGKAKLTEASKEILNEIVQVLKNTEFVYSRLFIEGHTDYVGNDDSNLTLSKKRAKSVKNYLSSNGIPSQKMFTDGFGELKPLIMGDGLNPEQLLKNRRVEFRFD